MTRERILPLGWYPETKESCLGMMNMWKTACLKNARAVIAPHAGWMFSGHIAFNAISSLISDAEVVVIFGGHLGSHASPLVWLEQNVKTPFGNLEIDQFATRYVVDMFYARSDLYQDNTIEVLLPFVKYFFPDAHIVCVRPPNTLSSVDIGIQLGNYFLHENIKAVALGSTDLTHYGKQYNFEGHGTGKKARDWVKNTNDAEFIDAILRYDYEAIISKGTLNKAACSSGAVVASCAFADVFNAKTITLLEYGMSSDVIDTDSIVGYSGISCS